MFRFSVPTLLILAAPMAFAADKSLKEHIPNGVTPDPAQKAVVDALAAQVSRCDAVFDDEGNLVSLLLCNHQAFSRTKPETRPGADDATFKKLSVVPSLKELQLLKQPLSDDAFVVLQQWPDLKIFCIENHKGDDTGRFMLNLNGHKELERLELKHLFGLDGTKVDQLDTFPEMIRLELDIASATNKALPFLRRNPQVVDFELHRTTMNNEEIGEAVDALPNLKRFALKPGYGKSFDHRCLKHVARLDQLTSFGFHHWKEKMFVWEDGIEHLAKNDTLTHVECSKKFWNSDAMKRLREAKPKLQNTGNRIVVDSETLLPGDRK
ncbi:hypothetical protein [Stratiformator vulcanicus]|uniref:Leucine Rich repeats (2 copies) n=1 Tax=Stratiformator vulcanicus TaxID=2527980 RepID=A0A517R1W8_9PLAN|nr:hypothetical protein [Stratiformator vulcanicus]QDT37870.1 hypothetical protein Pan189_22530 [Stratiformator vulcanicus]